MFHGEDFDRVVGVTEAIAVAAYAKAELWRFDVLESLDVAFAGCEQAGQGVENAEGGGLIDSAEVGLGPVAPNDLLFDIGYWSEPCDLGGVWPMRSKSSELRSNSESIFSLGMPSPRASDALDASTSRASS